MAGSDSKYRNLLLEGVKEPTEKEHVYCCGSIMGNKHSGSTGSAGGVLQILPCGLQSFQSVFITSRAGFSTDNTSGLCSAESARCHSHTSGDSLWSHGQSGNGSHSAWWKRGIPCRPSHVHGNAASRLLLWAWDDNQQALFGHAQAHRLPRHSSVTRSLRWEFQTQTERLSWERPFLMCVKRWRGDRGRERSEREEYVVLLWSFKCLLPWRKGPLFLACLYRVKGKRRLWTELDAWVRFLF